MSASFLELVRSLASERFPEAERRKGHEPFCVQALLLATFGKPMDKKTWLSWEENPESLKFEHAAALARALGVSFAGMVADSQSPTLQTLTKERLLARKKERELKKTRPGRKVLKLAK